MSDACWPHWAHRQSAGFEKNTSATVVNPVGVISGSRTAWVDTRGRVFIDGCPWSIDWAVRPESAWKFPATEPVIRQRILEGAPIVESVLRYAGVDIVQRVWAIAGRNALGGEGWVICEIHNTAQLPIAAAFMVNGWDRSRRWRCHVEASATQFVVDGRPVAVAERPAARVVCADPLDVALAEDASLDGVNVPPEAMPESTGAAAVWPLITNASIRIAIPLGIADEPAEPGGLIARVLRKRVPNDADSSAAVTSFGWPQVVPPFDSVVAGWRTHLDAKASVELPDPAVSALVDRCVTGLLTWVGSDVALGVPSERVDAMASLALWGHTSSARDLESVYRGLSDDIAGAAAFVIAACASIHDVDADDFDERVAPCIEHALTSIERQQRRASSDVSPWLVSSSLMWCGGVMAGLGHDRLADRLNGVTASILSTPGASAGPDENDRHLRSVAGAALLDASPWPILRSLAQTMDACGGLPCELDPVLDSGVAEPGWDSRIAASVLMAVHRMMIGGEAQGVVVGAIPVSEWSGQNWQVSRLWHPVGYVSFAVRWHGARPALLWEIVPFAGEGAAPVTIRSGLDDAFVGSGFVGETLLSMPETLIAAVPVEGESFG